MSDVDALDDDLESITATLADAPAVSNTTPSDSPTTSLPPDTSSSSSPISSSTTPTPSSVSSTTDTPTPTPSSTTSSVSTSTPTPTSTPESSTSTATITSSSVPPETILTTSIVTVSNTDGTPTPSTVFSTITQTPSSVPSTTRTSTTTTPAVLAGGGNGNGSGGSGGLSTPATTAVAVVVPVVVVALLVVAGIFFWRRRKQKKATEEMRRKEVEDYGYNPNNDPTLPAVASENGNAMSEDHSSGYRGWGAAAASNRKMSTTLSGGHTQGQLSDAGSNQYRGTGSPNGGYGDGNSADPMLHNRRETMTSDDLGELGHAPVAGSAIGQAAMKRGPSNASSTYSAGNVSEVSDGPANPGNTFDAYQANNGYGYSQHGPYGDGTYGGSPESGGMPIVRDVSARRNTRIQQPGTYQQGNSGISQNF